MPRGLLIEGAGHHLDGVGGVSLEVGHLFRAFVDEHHDHLRLGVVLRDRMGDLLQDHGLAGSRRRDHQRPLTEAERGHHVDDPRFDAVGLVGDLELDAVVRVERRQVLEGRQFVKDLRIPTVDLLDAEHREIRLGLLRRSNEPLDHHAATETETAHLARTDVDVVGAGQVAVLRASKETEAFGHDLEGAFGDHEAGLLGPLAKDLEDELLLRQVAGVLDLLLLRDLEQRGIRQLLQLGEVEVLLLREVVAFLELVLELRGFEFELLVGGNRSRRQRHGRDARVVA